MKILKKATIASLTVAFLLAPINPAGFIKFFQSARAADDLVWDTDHTISEELIIASGVKLTIKKGVTITFDGGSIRSDGGMIITEGTTKEPVKFKNANEPSQDSFYSIFLTNNSVGDFKNAEFSGGGWMENIYPAYNPDLFSRALADTSRTGAIVVINSRLSMDGCVFKNNINAITIGYQQDASSYIQVNRTRFEDSNDFFVEYDNSQGISDFQYNWWGTGGTPSQGKISGTLNTSYPAPRADFHDPVIIVPGIMGSWNGQIDPILHSYDNLYEEFASNGYIPEQDLFTFPYEWRDSNIVNAVKLESKINEIKNQAHWPKVDIVAHSMGGLLARKYIESGHQNDVDQLITIGTPQLGAPKSYLMWEGGEFLGFWGFAYKRIFEQEAKENGFDDVFHYIQGRPMNSVKELLPVYNYLYDVDNGYALRASYPDNYPRNEFLENLNIQENVGLLKNVEFTKIIGKLESEQSTPSGVNVVNSDDDEMWIHGYPENYWLLAGSRGIIRNYGDGTVPLFSAESLNIPADYTISLASEHSDLPTDAQKDILETLTGTIPANEVRHSLLHDALIVTVFSPVDIQIVSPSKKRVGKDFSNGKILNEIPDAFYTGYQEPCANNPKKMCEVKSEFVTIPNPGNGDYKILTQGTDNGDFDIELAKISKNTDDPQNATEVTATIEGVTESAEETETVVDVQTDQINAGETNIKEKSGIDELIQKVEQYFSQGLIKTKPERNYLRSNLKRIKFLFGQINKVNNKKGIKISLKEKMIINLEKRINKRIDVIINHIQFKSKNQIDPPTAKSLIQDLNSIRP